MNSHTAYGLLWIVETNISLALGVADIPEEWATDAVLRYIARADAALEMLRRELEQ